MPDLKAQLHAMIQACEAVIEAVTEAKNTTLGGIPSGHLYALVFMPAGWSLENYQKIIDLLVRSGRIKITNHLLTLGDNKR